MTAVNLLFFVYYFHCFLSCLEAERKHLILYYLSEIITVYSIDYNYKIYNGNNESRYLQWIYEAKYQI